MEYSISPQRGRYKQSWLKISRGAPRDAHSLLLMHDSGSEVSDDILAATGSQLANE